MFTVQKGGILIMTATLDRDMVIEMFAMFSDLGADECERWRGFCVFAAERIESRLRPDADTEKYADMLCSAAAAWAYCDYLMAGSAMASSDEIRVGDIALKNAASSGTDKNTALEMRDYFMQQVAFLLKSGMPILLATGDREDEQA